MITINNLTSEYVGLSTDEKPVENVRNGSTFFEVDTSTNYAFDEEHSAWVEQTGSGSGGTGSIELGKIIVTNNSSDTVSIVGLETFNNKVTRTKTHFAPGEEGEVYTSTLYVEDESTGEGRNIIDGVLVIYYGNANVGTVGLTNNTIATDIANSILVENYLGSVDYAEPVIIFEDAQH